MMALLQPADQQRAREALEAVARDLIEHAPVADHPMTYARAALFFHELERCAPELAASGLADGFLERSLEKVAQRPLPLSLHGGLLEVAWILGDYSDDDDACADVDSLVLEQLQGNAPRSYDLVSGLVGMGLYGIRGSGTQRGQAIVGAVLAELLNRAVEVEGGLAFHTSASDIPPPQRVRAPHGYFNLGIAHGVAGVIALASAACELGIEGGTARHLAQRCGSFLRQTLESNHACWIASTSDGTPSDVREPANIASWCYGVSGTCSALAHAAAQLDDPALLQWSVDQFCLAVEGGPAAGLRGGCVCHGHASVALAAIRLAQLCPDAPKLRNVAQTSLLRLLEARGDAAGLGGFEGGAGTVRHADASLLEGSVGIGLTLITALSGVRSSWGGLLGWPTTAP